MNLVELQYFPEKHNCKRVSIHNNPMAEMSADLSQEGTAQVFLIQEAEG